MFASRFITWRLPFKRVWFDLSLLSLIALITAAVFYLLLLQALDDAKHTAYLVNTAGKQRMLSQNIALDVFRLKALAQDPQEDVTVHGLNRQQLLARMQSHLDMMALQNRQLTLLSPVLDREPLGALSPALQQMYFGEGDLFDEVNSYIALVEQVMHAAPSSPLWNEVNYRAEPLLQKLNQVVNQYQLEGEQGFARIEEIKNQVWLIILFMVLAQVTLIFLPLLKKVLSLHKVNQNLQDIAEHDALTGLRNRVNMEQALEQAWSRFQCEAQPFAVLMLDIDFFKHVNDDYGHQAGDMVLKRIAELLTETVRGEDAIFRAGGEEFVVVLQDIDYSSAREKAEQLRRVVASCPFDIHKNTPLYITISIGGYHVACEQDQDIKHILKNADQALYRSKREGRNRVSFCDVGSGHSA